MESRSAETLVLRINLAYELLDPVVVESDEFHLDFEVTRDELRHIGSQVRQAIANFPPRTMKTDYRFGYLHAFETGYWIHGTTVYPIAETHVSAIIGEPGLFGLTTSGVEETYLSHGEQMGTEGHAREELIRRVATNGWIRVRHYRRPADYWSIQCSRVGSQGKVLLQFISLAFEIKIMQIDDEIRLTGYDDDVVQVYPFSEGGASKMIADFSGERKTP